MRETVKSLGWYFIIIGGLVGAGVAFSLGAGHPPGIGHLVNAIISIVLIGCGVRIRPLLQTAPHTLLGVVYGMGALALIGDVAGLVTAPTVLAGQWVSLAVTILLTWYLARSVKRLSAEVQPSQDMGEVFE